MEYFLIVTLMMISAPLRAETRMDVESSFLRNLRTSLFAFEIENGGHRPTNWNGITNEMSARYLGLLSERLRVVDDGGENSILDAFVFIPAGVAMPNPELGEVVLMSARGHTNTLGEWGRWIVSRSSETLRRTWIRESAVTNILQVIGLPVPVGVPINKTNALAGSELNPVISTPSTIQPGLLEKTQTLSKILDGTNRTAAVPSTAATATPDSGSWLGVIIVAAIGLLAGIFLLFRAKQK